MLAQDALKTKAAIGDFYRGDSVVYLLEVLDSEGNAIDLQSSVIWFTLQKDSSNEPDLQLRFTCPADNNLYEFGRAIILIAEEYTNSLEPGVYNYDLQLEKSIGPPPAPEFVKTLALGKLRVIREFTRR